MLAYKASNNVFHGLYVLNPASYDTNASMGQYVSMCTSYDTSVGGLRKAWHGEARQ